MDTKTWKPKIMFYGRTYVTVVFVIAVSQSVNKTNRVPKEKYKHKTPGLDLLKLSSRKYY